MKLLKTAKGTAKANFGIYYTVSAKTFLAYALDIVVCGGQTPLKISPPSLLKLPLS